MFLFFRLLRRQCVDDLYFVFIYYSSPLLDLCELRKLINIAHCLRHRIVYFVVVVVLGSAAIVITVVVVCLLRLMPFAITYISSTLRGPALTQFNQAFLSCSFISNRKVTITFSAVLIVFSKSN